MNIPTKLQDIASSIDLEIRYQRLTAKRKNGWPVESEKPYHLTWLHDGKLIASFRTLDALENNLRGRAGC